MRNSSNNSNRFKIVETLKKMVPGTQARSRFFKEKKRLTNGMKVKIHGGAEDEENDKDSNLGFLKVESGELSSSLCH